MIWFSSDYHLDHDNIIRFDNRPDANIDAMNARIVSATNEFVGEKDWFVYHGDMLLNKKIDRHDNRAYIDRVKSFLDQLRCKNVIFISGNHDRTWNKRQGIYRPNFDLWNLFRVWECGICGVTFDREGRFGLPKKCKNLPEDGNSPPCNDADDNPIYNLHPMGYELRITKRICSEQNLPIDYDGLMVTCTHYSHRVWNKSHHKKGKSIHLYGHSHGGLPGIKNSFDVGFNVWNRPLPLFEIMEKIIPSHNDSEAGRTYFGHHNNERDW